MTMPLWLGRFNTRVTNRFLAPIVVQLPGFGRVVHVGRQSGREFRNPVVFFRRGDRGVFAMFYGTEAQWVKNVLAAGSCRFEAPRSAAVHLESPELVRDPTRRLAPWFMRPVLALLRVSDFLVLRVVP